MKNILITGGGMGNKGAQAMTFICVKELKKRFPRAQIVLLTLGQDKDDDLNFSIKKISYPALKCVVHPISKFSMLIKRIDKLQVNEIESIYSNAILQIDISGYALGSNWSDATVDYYLSCIECAHKFNVPVYIMPQSFGPFDYNKNSVLNKRIQTTMRYPEVIFAREEEGLQLMQSKFSLTNVKKSCDMVLRCESAIPEDIYKKVQSISLPGVVDGSVAVIPNVRNFDNRDKSVVMGYYRMIIEKLLLLGRNVYLLHHSKEDAAVCEELKAFFENDKRVAIIKNDLDCFEYEELVKKFVYVIASRYHSIVHALKNSVPCISLGWAIKYLEVLSLVGSEDCVLDVRGEISQETIDSIIQNMDQSFGDRKKTIENCIQDIQSQNIFDILDRIGV